MITGLAGQAGISCCIDSTVAFSIQRPLETGDVAAKRPSRPVA